MIRKSLMVAALSGSAFLAGCGGSEPAPAPAIEPSTPAAATEAPQSPAPAEDAKPAMDGAVAPAATAAPAPAAAAVPAAAPAADGAVDATHQKLVGTKWKLDDFDVQFKDAKTVSLNGGQLTMITGGQGIDATYTYANGALEVTAMGQTKKGTWDGEALVVEGTAATKQP